VSQERKVGSVTYQEVGDEYFQQRGLRRHAGVWSLWALGVAAVISGDFYGWNLGLGVGGFGGLLIATVVITVMYYGLCYCIAEMSPALPHTGGAYSFARSAMGPWGGFITGLAENMEYVITPAVVVGAIGILMQEIVIELFDVTGSPFWNSQPFWWLVFYVIFVGLNIAGIETTMRFTVIINFLALGILAFFFISAIVSGEFSTDLLTNTPAEPGNSSFLPFGIGGIFKALPFAIWFYLAIEELPLAAEESMDPKRDIPKATMWGLGTLVITAFLTLFLNTGVVGSTPLGESGAPLFDGFRAVFGDGTGAALLALIGVIGLVASFHTIIYAYGRNTYSLSRAGYFPKVLSVTHGERKTPHVALIAGAVVGFILAYVIYWFGQREGDLASKVVGALLNMAVFAAVISYAMQCLSFVLLRKRLPNIERPFRSPLGIPGALIALAISLVTLASLFASDPAYRNVAIGAALWYVLGLVYFAVWGRRRLVKSPEESFALRAARGEQGPRP
jgi:ethanolamine permease